MISLIKIITLALADAINPCALAVMVMVLTAILLANPDKKSKVIMGGLSFIAAVFIGYFFYGLIIINVFKVFTQFASVIYPYLTKGLAMLAIILGLINIKDFIKYKPGTLGSEMPMRFRPRVKQLIKKITGCKGAFVIGILVTLFLLPCTVGPYIIAGGTLAGLSLVQTIPFLLLYNTIFIFPMLLITIIIYLGVASAEKISNWKERNIKYIHLATGILLISLGILLFTGLI